MANEAAYELRAEYDERYADVKNDDGEVVDRVLVSSGFEAGSVAVGDRTFDVKDALDSGGGFIVATEALAGEYNLNLEALTNALDSYPPLKRAQLGAARAAAGESDGLDKLNHEQLDQLAADSDIDLGEAAEGTKAEKVAVLREQGVSAREEG